MLNFIEENKEKWIKFKSNNIGEKILIEEPSYPPVAHVNAVFALILNQAKGYRPVWLHDKVCKSEELLKSYVENSQIIKNRRLNFFYKVYILLVSIIKFIKIYFTKDVLSFKFQGIRYGDILYDTYLIQNNLATVDHIKLKMIKFIILCLYRHLEIKKILTSDNYKAVLVSHQVGISCGVMLRVALKFGYDGYLRCGHHKVTLQRFTKLDEVYDYEYKPSVSEIEIIIDKYGDHLDEEYKRILDIQVSGRGTKDGQFAFSSKNKWYKDKESFNKDYRLDINKKNVFVMLHAFNDHPHSHFRWMIFRDYYDWFIQTLEFAKKNNHVNWIFKQHPSAKWYKTKDVVVDRLFDDVYSNIRYISEDTQIDTRSLVSCADLVVTCLGSAGFEIPAMGAIPSLTASDNFYSNLGFVIEPTTKEEYFEALVKANEVNKLSVDLQNKAKATFIFIYDKSRVAFSAAPQLSMSDEKDPKIEDWYFDRVIKQYELNKDKIISEVDNYINKVKRDNFKKLISL